MTRFFPDYTGGGIVNLMRSIVGACGDAPVPPSADYAQLTCLPAARLATSRHVVLIVADGLGRHTLDAQPALHLHRHAIATLSSVFPSTTASAITTFMTGLAPAQHALTGWHMRLDEIGQILAILPLTPRVPPACLPATELPPRIFDQPTLFQRLARESWVLAPRYIAGTPFNAWHSRGAHSLAYDGLDNMFAQLAGLLDEAAPPRYIYAYLPDIDALAHRHGSDSMQVRVALQDFDAAFHAFAERVRGSDSWLLVTADHGLIDSPPERLVELDDHPRLAAMLAQPLCGERRAAYCYVRPEQRAAFEDYVATRLAHCAEWRRSTSMIAEGWFGPPPAHPRLAARIGDYVLLMKDDWTIRDRLAGEKSHAMLGVHGGTDAREMQVPLIAVHA